jgi:phage tail-like protein
MRRAEPTRLVRGVTGEAVRACSGSVYVGLDRLDLGRAAIGATTRVPAPTRPTGADRAAQRFSLEIDGVTVGGFVGVDGGSIDAVEYRNGDDPITHRRPGKTKFKNIVLRVGEETSPTVRAWYEQVVAGKTERKSGSIVYVDREGNELVRIGFSGGYPVKHRETGSGMATGRRQYSALASPSDGHLVEEIELVVEKIERP